MKVKLYTRRIIGLIEFLVGISFPVIAIYTLIKKGNIHAEYKHFIALPLYYAFIKYGWRWMIGTVNLDEEKPLKPTDKFHIAAVQKAQNNIDLFLSYLRKGTLDCFVYIEQQKHLTWLKVQYKDEKNVVVEVQEDECNQAYSDIKETPYIENLPAKGNPDDDPGFTIPVEKINDWFIILDDKMIGYYTLAAKAEKLQSQGFKIKGKMSEVLKRVVN